MITSGPPWKRFGHSCCRYWCWQTDIERLTWLIDWSVKQTISNEAATGPSKGRRRCAADNVPDTLPLRITSKRKTVSRIYISHPPQSGSETLQIYDSWEGHTNSNATLPTRHHRPSLFWVISQGQRARRLQSHPVVSSAVFPLQESAYRPHCSWAAPPSAGDLCCHHRPHSDWDTDAPCWENSNCATVEDP